MCKLLQLDGEHFHSQRQPLQKSVFAPMLAPIRTPLCVHPACHAPLRPTRVHPLYCNTVKSSFFARFSYYLRYYENKNGLIVSLRLRRALLPCLCARRHDASSRWPMTTQDGSIGGFFRSLLSRFWSGPGRGQPWAAAGINLRTAEPTRLPNPSADGLTLRGFGPSRAGSISRLPFP
jgi:hypothetical protein